METVVTFFNGAWPDRIDAKIEGDNVELYGIKYCGNSASRVVRKLDVGGQKYK